MTEQDQSGNEPPQPEPEDPPDTSWAKTEQIRKEIRPEDL